MTRVSTNQGEDVLVRVSRALGREGAPRDVPAPPAVDEAIARLVGHRGDAPAAGAAGDVDVVGEFIRMATTAAKMIVRETSREALAESLVTVLHERQARRIVLTKCGLLAELDLAARLTAAGFESVWWSETTLDATYEADAGVTDVWFAVAETGSLVVRASVEHGRAVSLVPPVHIAVLERSQMVADLIDAMRKIADEGPGSATIFITGPSKTSDIEMTLVTGVHGPMEVVVLLVSSE